MLSLADVSELVRVANIILSSALLLVTVERTVLDWPHIDRRGRLVRVHLIGYLFVTAYGTAEALASGAPAGVRVFMLLAVHTSFALALWRSRRDPIRC